MKSMLSKFNLCLLSCALLVGCTQQTPTVSPSTEPAKTKEEKGFGHTHGAGPNGGIVFDLGKYHVEFTVDHPAKTCQLLFVTADKKEAQPLPVEAKEFMLTTKETKTAEGTVVAPMSIKMLPQDEKDGKASKFIGTDPGIGNVADFEGTVLGEIDGKPSKGTFKE